MEVESLDWRRCSRSYFTQPGHTKSMCLVLDSYIKKNSDKLRTHRRDQSGNIKNDWRDKNSPTCRRQQKEPPLQKTTVGVIDSGGHVFKWLWWSKYSHVHFLTAAFRYLNHPHFADGKNRDSRTFHNLLKIAQEISVRAASFPWWFPEPGILWVTEYFLKWQREGCQLFTLPIKGNKNNNKHQLSAFYKRKDSLH